MNPEELISKVEELTSKNNLDDYWGDVEYPYISDIYMKYKHKPIFVYFLNKISTYPDYQRLKILQVILGEDEKEYFTTILDVLKDEKYEIAEIVYDSIINWDIDSEQVAILNNYINKYPEKSSLVTFRQNYIQKKTMR